MMVCKVPRRRLLASCAALALAFPAFPQTASQDQGQGPVIKTEVNLVNVFATVRDKNHRVVTDLKQDDFRIAEDGHDEKIAFFSSATKFESTIASTEA